MATVEQLNRIKEIIQNHIGKENQISSGEIGPALGIHEDATHVQVRSLIRETIEKLKIPIGGGNRGYYLIRNEEELQKYTEGIDSRVNEMQRRKDMVEEAFRNYY